MTQLLTAFRLTHAHTHTYISLLGGNKAGWDLWVSLVLPALDKTDAAWSLHGASILRLERLVFRTVGNEMIFHSFLRHWIKAWLDWSYVCHFVSAHTHPGHTLQLELGAKGHVGKRNRNESSNSIIANWLDSFRIGSLARIPATNAQSLSVDERW